MAARSAGSKSSCDVKEDRTSSSSEAFILKQTMRRVADQEAHKEDRKLKSEAFLDACVYGEELLKQQGDHSR